MDMHGHKARSLAVTFLFVCLFVCLFVYICCCFFFFFFFFVLRLFLFFFVYCLRPSSIYIFFRTSHYDNLLEMKHFLPIGVTFSGLDLLSIISVIKEFA